MREMINTAIVHPLKRMVAAWRSLSELTKIVLIASATIIIATIVYSGFFTVVPLQGGGIYIVNKYTGEILYCAGYACRTAAVLPPAR